MDFAQKVRFLHACHRISILMIIVDLVSYGGRFTVSSLYDTFSSRLRQRFETVRIASLCRTVLFFMPGKLEWAPKTWNLKTTAYNNCNNNNDTGRYDRALILTASPAFRPLVSYGVYVKINNRRFPARAYVSDVLKNVGLLILHRLSSPVRRPRPALRSIFDHKSYGAFTVRFSLSYARTRVHTTLLKRPKTAIRSRMESHFRGEVMGIQK